jgi:thiosulfate dehydrogenase
MVNRLSWTAFLAIGFAASMSSVGSSMVSAGESLPADGLPPPPALQNLPAGEEGALIRYGQDLIANTADWIGPKGRLKHLTKSRMACRNCHLDSGQRPLGNSWLDTYQLYPEYRAREGRLQTLAERINLCFEHPLQSKPLPLESKEMRALLSYYRWIGKNRPVLWADPDNRLPQLRYLDRAASPELGKKLFMARCSKCHGEEGQGKLRADGAAFVFPPLWGDESYMKGASLSRVSTLARFIRANMPLGATGENPLVSEEEAWDLAAFVNSRERPDWSSKVPFPRLEEKPFDYPVGPYADDFPESQHLYGPFQPILDWLKAKKKPVVVDSTGI